MGPILTYRRAVLICSAMVAGISTSALIGWAFDLRYLAGISIEWIPMAPSTAFLFIVLATSLAAVTIWPSSNTVRYTAIMAACLVTLFSIIVIMEDVSGVEGIERFLVSHPAMLGQAEEGRMSPLTAFNFLLAGFALYLFMFYRTHRRIINGATVLSIIIAAIGLCATIGYLYGSPLLYGGATVPMALITAVAFMILGAVFVLYAGPGVWPTNHLTGKKISARLLRVFLPLTLTFVVAEGWFAAILHEQLQIKSALVSAITAVVFLIIATFVTIKVAQVLGGTLENAEKKLAASEEKYRTLFESASEGILMAGIDDKSIHDGNKTICEMLGYSNEELNRLSIKDIHPQDAMPQVMAVFEKQAREEMGTAPSVPMKRNDGSVFYAEINSAPIELSKKKYLLGFFRDITEKKRAADALIESEENYRALFENSPVPFAVQRGGILLHANKAALALVGATGLKEVIGKQVTDFVHPDYRESAIQHMRGVLEQEKSVNPTEEKFIRLNGEVIDVEVAAMPVKYKDKRAIQVAMQDLTERKKLREQLIQAQKMESLGTLAGGVAHDFNNYLTAIKGYADLVMMDLLEGDPVRESLNEIYSAAIRAEDLTRQLLFFGRREKVVPDTIDLGSTVSDLLKMLGRLIGENYSVDTNIDGDLKSISADKGLIEQVIMNLVVNAKDAMPGGGKLYIEAKNEFNGQESEAPGDGVRAGGLVRLSIKDCGSGMNKDTLDHIFEPFFTTKEEGKGTGLGLSVVYGIIEQHGGWIDVDSSVGSGTAFNIYFPAAGFEKAADESHEEAGEIIKGFGQNVLLIEDDDAIRAFAHRILSDRGFTVFAAANAREAVDLFNQRAGDFGLVFSDVILPDENGFMLADRLQQLKPGLNVLLASGNTGELIDRQQIIDRGFYFLQKPYTLSDLSEVLRGLL